MKYDYYEKKINDVIMKCPIESGIEILVYNVLNEVIDSTKLSLVDINRLRKDRDYRLTTDGGIADIAVLSEDFEYRTDVGTVYGFIEVKATNELLSVTGQIEGQKKDIVHYIYTNGLAWKYYKDGEINWEIVLSYDENQACSVLREPKRISIDSKKFDTLIDELKKINWF
ncbi:MAG: hypothetical protein PHX08_01395 [Lachnospiraceae bacterium]|jgi:hypothetical protein|uniref:Uncharacterized protein n=1 Tax=Peptoclostridium acidaminophilum DSM 3953 TaxID=1286171 RepID=W8T200_PEPAC|nr:hypothetical protein [Peptoclostridium acidaminophilum]AHM55769.1 hypothetical protein EAL2_c04670 [Peptoclostridium acidaminophilum DSM 3953]MBP7320217.1 hypothetical protein [Lachnospiraceae bacterium]MDD3137613.1 hypothetical protein [Lachnospiraceae bacterium]